MILEAMTFGPFHITGNAFMGLTELGPEGQNAVSCQPGNERADTALADCSPCTLAVLMIAPPPRFFISGTQYLVIRKKLLRIIAWTFGTVMP